MITMPTAKPIGVIASNKYQINTERQEIVFWEEGNPRCVVNLLSEALKKKALEIPVNILSLSDEALEKAVEPSLLHEQLRLAFWDEYFVSCDNSKKMRIESIYPRVCSRDHFYNVFVNEDLNLAYMLRPPGEYMLKMRSLLELGHKQLEKVLRMPLINAKGEPRTMLIAEIVKITALLDNRVKGAVVQKLQIDQRSQNVHQHQYEPPKNDFEIRRQLAEVQREITELNAPKKMFDDIPEAVDVTGTRE